MNDNDDEKVKQAMSDFTKAFSRVVKDDIGFPGLREQVDKIQEELKETKEKSEETKEAVKKTQNDSMIFFGVFVSFITYISAEIQILETARDIYILFGLSTLFLGGILLFPMVLKNLVNGKDTWGAYNRPSFWMCAFLIGLSGIFFYLHFEEDEKTIDTRYFCTENDELKECKGEITFER